jgi:hypothetical protein
MMRMERDAMNEHWRTAARARDGLLFADDTSGTKERAPDGCALMLFPYSRSNGPDFDDLSALAATPNLQGGLRGWR